MVNSKRFLFFLVLICIFSSNEIFAQDTLLTRKGDLSIVTIADEGLLFFKFRKSYTYEDKIFKLRKSEILFLKTKRKKMLFEKEYFVDNTSFFKKEGYPLPPIARLQNQYFIDGKELKACSFFSSR